MAVDDCVWQSAIVDPARRPGRRYLLAAARHPARSDGVIAAALFLLPWAVLVGVSRHHLDTGTMVAVISALAAAGIGLSTLWLTWAALRVAKRTGVRDSSSTLGQVADHLASAVGAQWESEAAVRRLNDPYPLPVAWVPADASLTDSWASLVKLASGGAGWPVPSSAGTWAADPEGLAGTGRELVDVLARVPTGRLVVLGEPGAGKTMLMVRLVLDLLACRSSGGPVPFLASVASWNPVDEELREWLTGQLLVNHPSLASPPPDGTAEPTEAAALLAAGLILPILDGLDEIPGQVRGPAISRINDVLRSGEQLVVTSRTQPYREAVRPEGGVEVTLRAAAAIQLRPLSADTVRDYLCDDAGGPIAKARWAPVLSLLGSEAPVAQALTTPLMVGLARTIYNPRPGELTGELRNPDELCDPALADRAAVESMLFDAFIPAAYRQRPRSGGRRLWSGQQAEPWLIFLARFLERTIDFPDLGWWRLQRTVPLAVFGLVATLPVWLVVAFPFIVAHALEGAIVDGVAVGLVFGFAVVLTVGLRRSSGPSGSALWHVNVRGLAPGLLLGLAATLIAGLTVTSTWSVVGYGPGSLLAVAALLAAGIGVALRKPPGSRDRIRRQFGGSAFFVGLILGLGAGVGGELANALMAVLGFGFDNFVPDQGALLLGLSNGIYTALYIVGGLAGVVVTGAAFTLRRWSSLGRLGMSRLTLPVIFMVALGLIVGFVPVFLIAGRLTVYLAALLFPAIVGIGLAIWRRRRPGPSRGVRWRPGISALIAAAGVGLAALAIGLSGGLAAGLAVGLAAAFVFAFAGGIEGVPPDPGKTVSPRSVLSYDRRAAFMSMFASMLTVGPAVGVVVGISPHPETDAVLSSPYVPAGVAAGIAAGVTSGIIFSLATSALNTAWPSYQLARAWLTLRRKLPWSLIAFLEDAHQRGVLRQAGAVYQFRHIELQHRLADRHKDTQA